MSLNQQKLMGALHHEKMERLQKLSLGQANKFEKKKSLIISEIILKNFLITLKKIEHKKEKN